MAKRPDYSKTSDNNLLSAYARNEGWRTYTVEDECRRLYLMQEMGVELQRRGLKTSPLRILEDEDEEA